MKSTLVADVSTTPIHPLSVAETATHSSKRKIRKIPAVQRTIPPSEETLNRLNGIGQQYPFCVYYKHKRNDPL